MGEAAEDRLAVIKRRREEGLFAEAGGEADRDYRFNLAADEAWLISELEHTRLQRDECVKTVSLKNVELEQAQARYAHVNDLLAEANIGSAKRAASMRERAAEWLEAVAIERMEIARVSSGETKAIWETVAEEYRGAAAGIRELPDE